MRDEKDRQDTRPRISHTVSPEDSFLDNYTNYRRFALCNPALRIQSEPPISNSKIKSDLEIDPLLCFKCSKVIYIGDEEEICIELKRKKESSIFVHGCCFSCCRCGIPLKSKYSARIQDNGEFWCDQCNEMDDSALEKSAEDEFMTVRLIQTSSTNTLKIKQNEEEDFSTMRILR
jgi:hypothetical protein